MSAGILVPPITILAVVVGLALIRARGQRAHPVVWLSALYLGCSVTALWVNRDALSHDGIGIGEGDVVTMIGYGMSLALALIPAFALRSRSGEWLDNRLLLRFVKASTPLILFSFAYLTPFAISAMSLGADVVRFDLNNLGVSLLPESPFTTVAVVVAHFYSLYALAFVILTRTRAPMLWRATAALGSTLYILNALCFAARDGVVWFAVAFLWAAWYAGATADPVFRVRIRRFTIPLVVVGFAVFARFTVQRFGTEGVGDSLLGYYGRQPYVFATTVAEQEVFYAGALRFPLFVSAVGPVSPIQRWNPYEWNFGTFARDLYSEGGWGVLFGGVVLVSAALLLMFRVTERLSPESYALLSMLYVQFMAQGVFYLRLGSRAGNLYIIVIIVLALLLLFRRTVTLR